MLIFWCWTSTHFLVRLWTFSCVECSELRESRERCAAEVSVWRRRCLLREWLKGEWRDTRGCQLRCGRGWWSWEREDRGAVENESNNFVLMIALLYDIILVSVSSSCCCTVWDTHSVHGAPVPYIPCWMVPCILVFYDHATLLRRKGLLENN